ncbi:homeodomain-like protein, partial [Tanacetum coccineum]
VVHYKEVEELIQPFEDPKRVSQLDRKLLKTTRIAENMLEGVDKFTFPVDFIILDIPEDFKTPLILGRPFLSTAHAIINVFKANITLNVKIDNFFKDLNEPLELRHDQIIDLGPAIEEGEVIDAPIKEMVKTRHDDDKITNRIEDYPSFSDLDRKIYVIDAYNLRFFCMIGYEHIDASLFPLLSINMMSKRFYNSIMKDKLEIKGKM